MNTLLLLARQGTAGGKPARDAVGKLLMAHKHAIYGVVRIRCSRYGSDAAYEIAGRFVESLWRRKTLRKYDRKKARFGTWMRALIENFCKTEVRLRSRLKRQLALPGKQNVAQGGASASKAAQKQASIAAHEMEVHFITERRDDDTPLTYAYRRLAYEMVQAVLDDMRAARRTAKQIESFDALLVYMPGWAGQAPPHAETAQACGVSEDVIKTRVRRLGAEMAERLTERVRETMPHASDAEVTQEIQELIDALGRPPGPDLK